jgi:hypothetical protein
LGPVVAVILVIAVVIVVIIMIARVSPLLSAAIATLLAGGSDVPPFALDPDDLVDLATVEPDALARGADVDHHPRAIDLFQSFSADWAIHGSFLSS